MKFLDKDGLLYFKSKIQGLLSKKADVGLGIEDASPSHLVYVKSVDSDGVPTEYDVVECSLLPSLNLFIDQYSKRVVLDGSTSSIILNDYEYNVNDIFDVYINGLHGDIGYDYTISTLSGVVTLSPTTTTAGTVISVSIKKAIIDFIVLSTDDSKIIVTDTGLSISV